MNRITLQNIKDKKEYKRDRNWAYKQIIQLSKKYNVDKNNEKSFLNNILMELHKKFNERYPDQHIWKYELKKKEQEYRKFKFNIASDYAKRKYILEHSMKEEPTKNEKSKVKTVQKKTYKNKPVKKELIDAPVPKKIMDKIEYRKGFIDFLKNKDNKFHKTWSYLDDIYHKPPPYFIHFLNISYKNKCTKLFTSLHLDNVDTDSLKILIGSGMKIKSAKEYLNRIIEIKKKSIIIPLGLSSQDHANQNHANLIFINKVQKIIYHFEPHGIYLNNLKYTFMIHKYLFNFFKPLYDKGYVFKSYFLDTFFRSSGIEYTSLLSKNYRDFFKLIKKKYKEIKFKRYKKLYLQEDLPFCVIYCMYIASLLVNNVYNSNTFMLIKQNVKHLDFKILTFLYYVYIITHGKDDKYGFYKIYNTSRYKIYYKDKSFKPLIRKIINNYNLYKKKKREK